MIATGAHTKTTYREAVRAALREALEKDPRVFLMGEDVGKYGGTYACSLGLFEEFGPERIRDTPLSESGFVGMGIGAAMGGMRPIVEIMTVNFSLENYYAHIPGLKVLAPATVEDARGMLWTALQDPDPVIIFEHATLYGLEGELADDAAAVPIDRAAVRRSGKDVTLIAYGGTVGKALEAADGLASRGVDAEVIDLRTLRPLDDDTIVASVCKTRRVVVVDEGWKTGSLAGEVCARIMERAFYELDAPPARVCSAEVPIPYAKHLEDAALPQAEDVITAALGTVAGHG